MTKENYGFCTACQKPVSAYREETDGRIYLVRCCERCGENKTLLSSHAAQYMRKKTFDEQYQYRGCSFDCASCKHPTQPKTVFIDITNRCNLYCPICILHLPSMGFHFEPPMEYFDRIFKHFGDQNPLPSINLFGGEPTVREDLTDIIELAHSYQLATRVVTNGLRLADEEYCRDLLSTGTKILFSYDGANETTYKKFRDNSSLLSLKLRALDNIRKYTKTKIIIMYVIAKGINDMELDGLFQFLHDRSDFIDAVDFIPITPTWPSGRFPEFETERITIEDVENIVDETFSAGKVEFLPAGVFENYFFMKFFNVKSNPFTGAHPNCESFSLLISDGKSYNPLSFYLKKSMYAVVKEIEDKQVPIYRSFDFIKKLQFGTALEAIKLNKVIRNIIVFAFMGNILLRNARIGKILDAKGLNAAAKMLRIFAKIGLGHEVTEVLREHTAFQNVLRVVVLPFEDDATLESARLERCTTAFAYFDHKAKAVKTIPGCAWGHHKNQVLAKVTKHYDLREESTRTEEQPRLFWREF